MTSRAIRSLGISALLLPGLTLVPGIAASASAGAPAPSAVASFPTAWCKTTATSPYATLGLSFARPAGRLSGSGTVHVTPLFVDFADAPGRGDPASAYAAFGPQAIHVLDGLSHGHLVVDDTLPTGWLRMSKPSTSYSALSFTEHFDLMAEAVSLADDSVDFSQTDFVLVVAPQGALGSAAFTSDPYYGIKVDGATIANGLSTSISAPWTDQGAVVFGVLKGLGLPNLFGGDPLWADPFSSNASLYGTQPELFAWEDWVVGWLKDSEALCLAAGTSTFNLADLTSNSGTRLATIPLDRGRFLALESRTHTGLDVQGVDGVLAYIVDPRVPSDAGPIRIATDDSGVRVPALVPGQAIDVEGNHIEVLARNAASYAVRVTAVTPKQPVPGAVTQLSLVAGRRTVTATWQAPAEIVSMPIIGYQYRATGKAWLSTSKGTAVITGVKRGTQVTVQVRALNALGPGPISSLKVTVG